MAIENDGDSLRDTIAAAIEAGTPNADAPGPNVSREIPVAPAPPSATDSTSGADDGTGEQSRDASGRFLPKDTRDDADGKVVPPDAVSPAGDGAGAAGAAGEAVTAPAEVAAPEHWAAPDKEAFAALPADQRKWVLDRLNAMESGWQPKLREAAALRDRMEPLARVLEPYEQQFALAGTDAPTAIRSLLAVHDLLNRDPAKAIRWLAERNGVDLAALADAAGAGQGSDGADGGYTDPQVAKLAQQVSGLTAHLRNAAQAQQAQLQSSLVAEVQTFSTAKDAAGKPVHPHFDEVAADILALLPSIKARSPQERLKEAYDRACWANPGVRAKVLAAEKATEAAKAHAERKAKADKAARASGSLTPGQSTPAGGTAAPDDIRGALEHAYAAAEGRA